MAVVNVPESVRDFNDFLGWWLSCLDSLSDSPLCVSESSLPRNLKFSASSVIHSSGHFLDSDSLGHRALLSGDFTQIVITETIFIDTESDEVKRQEYLSKYSLFLTSLLDQVVVPDCAHVHITHCSIDKLEQVIGISQLVNRINAASGFTKLILGLYRHPARGYSMPPNPSVDERRLPNKTQEPLALANFGRAIAHLNLSARPLSLILRGSIDDDDLWVPWAISELVKQTRLFLQEPGPSLRVLALARQFVYYPFDDGRLDLVDMKAVLNGSKVYIADSWVDISQVSPWTLTEVYASNRLGYYRRKNVMVRVTHDSRPVLIYVRGNSNFSTKDKANLYLDVPLSVSPVGPALACMGAAAFLDAQAQPPVHPRFVIDPPVWRVVSVRGAESINFKTNTVEYFASRSVDPEGATIIVSAWYEKSRFVRAFGWNDEVCVPAGVFVRAVAFVLLDSEGSELAKDWVSP